MKYSVRHRGVPVGHVELASRELISAGTMEPTTAYDAIRQIVRDGSDALLQIGFFGASSMRRDVSAAENVVPLRAAAELALDLVDANGHDVPTTFVNLIEPPGDTRVVVLARFGHATARVDAVTHPVVRRDGEGRTLETDEGVSYEASPVKSPSKK